MSEQTYKVELKVYSIGSEEEACNLREALEDFLESRPEFKGCGSFSCVAKEEFEDE